MCLVVIECNKNLIKFSVVGDIGFGAITVKQRAIIDDYVTEIIVNLPVQATFSLKYLLNFTKATNLSKTVNLLISNELPIVVEYKVGDLGYIRYVYFVDFVFFLDTFWHPRLAMMKMLSLCFI